MVEVKLEFKIDDTRIGERLDPEHPEKDVSLYLVVDAFKVNFAGNGKVYIIPEKTHVKEYPIEYCEECLKEGKRNKELYYSSHGKERHAWCKSHYAKVMRQQDRANACPKCADGYMKEAGIELEVRRCTHCGYEVHIPGRGVILNPTTTIFTIRCEDCANGPGPCAGDRAFPACFVAKKEGEMS